MFTLPQLGYDYNALEPHIDAQTMEIHHTKHHQGYVNKANKALENYPEWLEKSPCEVLRQLNQVPKEVQTPVQNNVGGVSNHTFFWGILSPNGGGTPQGKLAEKIQETFGSFEQFQEEFNAAAASRFGSGWAWLVIKEGELSVISTANQDSPLSLGYERILGLDVWEHAYYLKYQNKRPDYIQAFWNIVDWEKAQELYENQAS